MGRVEEPYVSITRKKQMPRAGQSEEVERQVGQAEGKLFTHRAAFARTSVIQAFLGSAPQLTLQLYICVLQQGVSVGRGEGWECVVNVRGTEFKERLTSTLQCGPICSGPYWRQEHVGPKCCYVTAAMMRMEHGGPSASVSHYADNPEILHQTCCCFCH